MDDLLKGNWRQSLLMPSSKKEEKGPFEKYYPSV
jgi:hypothetical protein